MGRQRIGWRTDWWQRRMAWDRDCADNQWIRGSIAEWSTVLKYTHAYTRYYTHNNVRRGKKSVNVCVSSKHFWLSTFWWHMLLFLRIKSFNAIKSHLYTDQNCCTLWMYVYRHSYGRLQINNWKAWTIIIRSTTDEQIFTHKLKQKHFKRFRC